MSTIISKSLTTKLSTRLLTLSPISGLISFPNCTKVLKNLLTFTKDLLTPAVWVPWCWSWEWNPSKFTDKAVEAGSGGVRLSFDPPSVGDGDPLNWWVGWWLDWFGDEGAWRAPSGESGVLHLTSLLTEKKIIEVSVCILPGGKFNRIYLVSANLNHLKSSESMRNHHVYFHLLSLVSQHLEN